MRTRSKFPLVLCKWPIHPNSHAWLQAIKHFSRKEALLLLFFTYVLVGRTCILECRGRAEGIRSLGTIVAGKKEETFESAGNQDSGLISRAEHALNG